MALGTVTARQTGSARDARAPKRQSGTSARWSHPRPRWRGGIRHDWLRLRPRRSPSCTRIWEPSGDQFRQFGRLRKVDRARLSQFAGRIPTGDLCEVRAVGGECVDLVVDPERDPIARPATRRGRSRDTGTSPSSRSRGRHCRRRPSPTRVVLSPAPIVVRDLRPVRRKGRFLYQEARALETRRAPRLGHRRRRRRIGAEPLHPVPPAKTTRDPSGEIVAPVIGARTSVRRSPAFSEPSAWRTNRRSSRSLAA